MMWAKRLLIGTGMAIGSLAMASGVAGAATCVSPTTFNEPGCVVPPTISAVSTTPSTSALPFSSSASAIAPTSTGIAGSSSSLPFTGADIEELAVVGAGAVLAGGLLLRRRRRTS
jgi:LPXTG-motif cell wall-anchored protein